MNLPIVSCAVLFSCKIEILSVNNRAKGRQFEDMLDVDYAYHFVLSSYKSVFIKEYYMLLPIIFKNAEKTLVSVYVWAYIIIQKQLLIFVLFHFNYF